MRHRPLHRALLGALVAGLLAGCGAGSNGDDVPEPGAAQAEPARAEAKSRESGEHAGHSHERKERPLPAFGGRTLEGDRLEVSSLMGRRLIVFFFNPEHEDANAVARAVSAVAAERGKHNFEILGVSMASTLERSRAFVAEHDLDFRVLDDSRATIVRRLGLRAPVAILGVDAEGYVTFGLVQFPASAPDAAAAIEEQLRTSLRLPEADDGSIPGARPKAPLFEASVLDGDSFRLADQKGRAVVLVFFLHTCPHCHEFLEFMREVLDAAPEDARPVLFGIEVTGRTYAVRESLRDMDLDFFPVGFDDDGSIRQNYGVFAGVPDIVLVDAEGRIAHRSQGWVPEQDGPLLRMRIAKLSGAPVPMLLRPKGFSGSEACGVCHEQEHQTWTITQHASAFDTLVKHASDSDAECVSCHVVGFGEPGGFDLRDRPAELENVGCESCHGRGGPHLSPEFAKRTDYSETCVACHDKKHSLGFEYASFLERVSHVKNAEILALPADERRKVLEARGAVRTNLLPSAAAHVGSEACQSCHPAEYETWAAGPHAGAVATLVREGKQGEADCLRCHTTAFGKPGGFPADGSVADHEDLARVGCESCHGPGGDHVAEGAKRLGTIVSLGDKCDSCVILQICGGCHDDANDPGFEFEVLEKIEKIRHGTIEAGTGKPLSGKSASRVERELPQLLAEAFHRADGTRPTERPWTGR